MSKARDNTRTPGEHRDAINNNNVPTPDEIARIVEELKSDELRQWVRVYWPVSESEIERAAMYQAHLWEETLKLCECFLRMDPPTMTREKHSSFIRRLLRQYNKLRSEKPSRNGEDKYFEIVRLLQRVVIIENKLIAESDTGSLPVFN